MVGNKIELNGKMVLDLSEDNTIESDVRIGKRFHKANGEPAVGTAQSFNEGGSGEQPTLYAPSIAIDPMTSKLTIKKNTNNGSFVSGYNIYVNDDLLTSTPSTAVTLTDYMEHTEDATVKVCATGDKFNNSEFVSRLWKYYTPDMGTPGLTYTAEGDNEFYICTGIGTATVADIKIAFGCKRILARAFADCSFIKTIKISGSVEQIDNLAFASSYSLEYTDFTEHTFVPHLDHQYAYQNSTNCKILVPAALYDEWVTTSPWKYLADRIVAV